MRHNANTAKWDAFKDEVYQPLKLALDALEEVSQPQLLATRLSEAPDDNERHELLGKISLALAKVEFVCQRARQHATICSTDICDAYSEAQQKLHTAQGALFEKNDTKEASYARVAEELKNLIHKMHTVLAENRKHIEGLETARKEDVT